jgi:hypothetical protein
VVSYAGSHDRTTFGYRNSRIGFRVNAPEVGGVKASGFFEFDPNGNQPANPPNITETAFWSNATLRTRHAWLKLETDYIDILFGQTWNLFGWQTNFHPNTVETQGVPGEVFSRATQFRLSRMFKTAPLNVEVAVAAARPPQRDSAVPDGHWGLRFIVNNWKGVHVAGGGGAQTVDGLSIGASGLVRSFRVKALAANPLTSNKATGWAVSIDGLIPVIPGTADNHGNALTLNASLQTGTGFNDQYSGFTGGISFPNVPGTMTAFTPGIANVDNGAVTYDTQGNLKTIDWTSYLLGLQYYLPPSGNVWIAANFAQMKSGNIASLVAAPGAGVFKKVQWYDANLFWNVVPSTRFGLEYAFWKDTFGDGSTASNHRVQFSGYFMF